MNQFILDFKELILLSNSMCVGTRPIITGDEFVRRLKKFNETHQKWGSDEHPNLGLTLLGNLTAVIQTIQNNDQKTYVITSMTNIVRTSVIDDIQFFIHLYNAVFFQIYQEQDVKLSEEIKLAVLEFCIELIKRSTKRVFQLLYNIDYGAKFSMGVFIAVQIAKEERSVRLRTTALDFLLFAMQYHRKNDKVMMQIVGDLFMLYLPGIIGRLQDIILRDETQPHLITVKALSCWGQLLCIVMQDLEEVEPMSDEEQLKIWMNLSKEGREDKEKMFDTKEALKDKSRTKNWLQAAAQTLRPLILKIPESRKHSHPKVRLELTVQIARLMDNCLMTLRTAINPMIEILISSSEDEESEVRDTAEFAIARFENRCRDKGGRAYLNVIEENMNSLVNKLPNVIHLRDDKAILNALQSLCGDLKILSNSGRLGELVNFSPNLTRFIRVLAICSRLDLYPEISTREYSVWDNEVNSAGWTKEWKRFKHFTEVKIRRKLEEICRLLGGSSERETILDYLFDRFAEDASSRNEVLFLINEVVSGSPDIQDNITGQFLNMYLNPDHLYLKLEVDDDVCTTVQEAQANITTVALLMEGIGKLAKVIGRKFEDHVLKSLYYVIEKVGSSYSVIRKSAMGAAVQMAKSLDLDGDVRLLIQKNVDYLTYHVTVKLRRSHPGVFDVVTVLMKNSPFEAVTNLEEIINNVLRNSSEKFDSPNTISYLRLFQTFVLCVGRWLDDEKKSKPTEENPTPEKSDVDLLVEFIREMEKPKDVEDEDDEGEVTEEQNEDAEKVEEREEKPELPKHIQLTIAIAETALNYLPSKDLDKKLIVLEILNGSVSILADRENELLPLVHKIWSPLVTRFEQMTDPLLINRSFALLYNLSRTSKDFIRRRTLKNVLPTLRDFLFKSAEKSKLKDSGSGYQFTQNFKLQKELLNKLGELVVDLGLTGKELDSVAECALPYLSSMQPMPLQENCRKLFTDFKDHDPYLVWYKLHPLAESREHAKNVRLIFDQLSPALK